MTAYGVSEEAHHSFLCMGNALESDILKMCGWIANYDHSGRWHVESKIQLQHIHPRFPKKRELASFGVLHHQPFHRPFLQASCAGHTLHLVQRQRPG